MKQTKTAQVITESVELEFVDPQGDATTIDADLVFDPADPYAVTMVFRTGAQEGSLDVRPGAARRRCLRAHRRR